MKNKHLLLTTLITFACLIGGEVMAQTAKSLPYSYGFEFTGTHNATNAANALTTEGWTTTNASDDSMIKTYPYHTGGKSYCFYVDTDKDYQYLISPQLENAPNLCVELYVRVTNSTNLKYQIGYTKSDTPNVTTNFTWTDLKAVSSTSYILASELFLTNGIKYIAIKFDRNNDTNTGHYLTIDDITLSIAYPTNIVVSPMSSLATLSWTTGYDESNWLLYYSTTNTAPTDYTTNVISIEANPTYTITGLTKNETYYAWVCAENNGIYSTWGGPAEFTPLDEFTLTVYNGTAGQAGAPFHYNTNNDNVKSQFIIPSTELTYLINKQITYLQFYHSVANQSWGNAKFEIYMKEFDSKTTFSTNNDYTDWSTMTKVYDGNAVFSTDDDKIMNIKLTYPYVYAGGNLMIGFKIITKGNTLSYCSWNGVSQTADNNTCIFTSSTGASGIKWLPKITFTSQFITFDNCNWGTGATPTAAQNVELKNDVTVANGTNAIANIIEMASGSTFTIESGATLACNNIVGSTTSNFTIANGGQLICNNAVNVTVNKEIAAASNWGEGEYTTNNWYFIASPISSAYTPAGDMIADDFDLYQFNPATSTWENYKQTGDHYQFNLVNERGYLYANNTGNDLSFTGAIVPYTATKDVDVQAGWNLIGNPFTYNVYASVDYYKLNEDNENVLNNRTGITPITKGTEPIAPCTGIIVKAEEPGSVTFSKTAPESGSKGSIGIMLSKAGTRNNATLDNAIISFNEGSQLEKFYFMEQNANLYIPQGTEEYAIVNAQAQGELPVNFKANENGQYTLTVNPEGVEMNYLHLIDNMTGTDIDLLSTPSYTFNAKTTDYESRFRLLFATNGIEENNSENATFAYINNGEIIVNGEGRIQVMDITGRILASHDEGTRCVPTTGMTPGVYVVRLINGESVRSQKIVVK